LRRFSARAHALRMNVTGTIRVRTPKLVLGGVTQWTLVASDDFGTPNLKARGWSQDKRTDCGGSGDMFLGGYCNFGDMKVTRTFHRLPVHTAVRLTARFHFFDKWEGQYAYAMINDRVVWVQNHRHCNSIFQSHCKGISVCGDDAYSDRLSTLIDIVLPHNNRALHPVLAPIELRVLGWAGTGPGTSKPRAGTPTISSTPGATNRFIDIEAPQTDVVATPATNAKGKGTATPKPTLKPGSKSSKVLANQFLPNFNDTDTVTITFGAVMPSTDACVASWGVDDVQLYTLLKFDDDDDIAGSGAR